MFPFAAIVFFTLVALAQAVPQLKRQTVTYFFQPTGGTVWTVSKDPKAANVTMTWCAIPLQAPHVTVPSLLLQLIGLPL
jgi:hypothetical protein